MKEESKIIVVTKRCIDATAYIDEVDKVPCSKCGEMVWLSIEWRRRKIDETICEHCFEKEKHDESIANITEYSINQAIKIARECYGIRKTDKEMREEIIKKMEERFGKKINIIK